MFHYKGGIISVQSYAKFILWYVGVKDIDAEMEEAIMSNNHTLVLDEELRTKASSYLDVALIPSQYKKHAYYSQFSHLKPVKEAVDSLHHTSILKRDKLFAEKIKQLYHDEVSPALADKHKLQTLPRTYSVLCEWDGLKDENLIFTERLKQAGVPVQVAFYDKCYHAMVPFIDETTGYKLSNKILDDLAEFINKNV
jgi:acetyl esterase/lipase